MTFSHRSIELQYYINEGISPVHYDLTDIDKHFQIRASLYRLLGIIPSFFKGKDILEVAPGSGHNSIYTSTLLPRTYDLVEPNPMDVKILRIYSKTFQLNTQNQLYFRSRWTNFVVISFMTS